MYTYCRLTVSAYVCTDVGMYCTRLERLDLSGVPVSQTSIRKLSQRCASLKVRMITG